MNGRQINYIRLNSKIPRLMIDDEVNTLHHRGLYSINNICWKTGMVELYTRAKDPSHPMYKKFWCDINDVTLAGTYLNVRQTEKYLNIINFVNRKQNGTTN